MIDMVSLVRIRYAVRVSLLSVVASFALLLIFSAQTSYAADTDNVGGDGNYTKLELGGTATIHVYALAGEYINFSVYPGENTGSPDDDCATMSIRRHDGLILSNGGSGTSTCSSGSPDSVVISYRVPATGPGAVTIDDVTKAYYVLFDAGDGDLVDGNGDTQAYQWRVWVSSDAARANQIHGRVWFDGRGGLQTWQDTESDANLTDNDVDFAFRYVRPDGYRYDMQYWGYQGIWSDFFGGVYGSAVSATDAPAYTSYYKYYNGLNINASNLSANKAYVFLDCDSAAALSACPSSMAFFESAPITAGWINGTAGVPGSGNPIPDPNANPAATTSLRYTGYNTASNLAGGVVTIPYQEMQSGYIRMKISRGATLYCQIDFRIDDFDGNSSGPSNTDIKWTFNTAGLAQCDSGTLKGLAAPVLSPATNTLTISAQAIHLGEMHFITSDTERQGGVSVEGNGLSQSRVRFDGLTTNTSTWIVWYDPFNRSDPDVCGSRPVRVADGGAVYSGSTDWDSMSSGRGQQPGGSIYTIGGRVAANSGSVADKWRLPTDSNVAGGVHGWAPAGSGCNWTATSRADGTAAGDSTWGNKRYIENWAYAYVDPAAKAFTIGGPSYTLTPVATPTPSKLVPNQSTTFSYSVSNNTASSNSTTWTVRSVVILPGAALPVDYRNGFDGTGRTCASYYRNPAPALITCNDSVATGSGTFPSTTIPSELVGQSYPVGTRICRSLTVDSYNQVAAPNARTSALSCAIVAAAPFVSVVGGNVWAGGSTNLATGYAGLATIRGSSSAGFGSFGEYGVFATDAIDYFGSSGQLGLSSASAGGVNGARLTFASAVSLGRFTSTHKITDMVAQYASADHNPAVLTGSVVTGSGVYKASGAVTVGLTSIAGKPKAVIYVPEGTVLITSNLTYDTSGAVTFKDLPSLTIIARNIIVTGAVSEIAGNFYASGRLVTCNEAPASPAENAAKSAAIITSGVCSARRLTINGAVTVANQVTNSLVLNRSFGGGAPGQAAEIIRMRPEVFLTPFENGSTLLTTVQETELPARY